MGEHVVLFDDYRSRYPYAADGRIPAPPGTGLLEPLITLTYLAARTTTVRLGTAMLLLPQRNPVYTAKEVSTLDWLSGGRVDLGVGVGWLEEEFEALNVPWARRGPGPTSTSRCCAPCGRTTPPCGFDGDFYRSAVQHVPQAGAAPVPPSTSAVRATPPCGGRPGGPGGTPSTASPEDLGRDWPRLGRLLDQAGRRPVATCRSPSAPTLHS